MGFAGDAFIAGGMIIMRGGRVAVLPCLERRVVIGWRVYQLSNAEGGPQRQCAARHTHRKTNR